MEATTVPAVNLMEASQQWSSRPADQRFETLEALHASVHGRRLRSRSVDVDTNRTRVKFENGKLVINGTLTPCEPTHWSFGQLAGIVGAPAGYLRTLPEQLIVECLNAGLDKEAGEREAVKFMTIESEEPGENVLQAVTSTTYGRIWDADCVDAVARLVERSGGKFHNPLAYDACTGKPKPQGLYASDRDVFMFMIDGGSQLEVGERAQLNRGFFCWNSEVGARTFGLTTFLFNTVCGNHIVWGAQDINKLIIRHTQGGPTRFDTEAAPVLMSFINDTGKEIAANVKAAMAFPLPRDEGQEVTIAKMLEFTARFAKFTKSEISNAIDTAKREEGQCVSLWDLIQGLTAYARGFDFVDARVDLETRAGKLLQAVAV